MTRVAVVAREPTLRDALVRVADAGTVEFDRVVRAGRPAGERGEPGAAAARRRRSGRAPRLGRRRARPRRTSSGAGRADLLAGEAQLAETARAGDRPGRRGGAARLDADRRAARSWPPGSPTVGGGRGPAARPARGRPADRGTRRGARGRRSRRWSTPTRTVPYADVDPTILAGLAYVVMFGAMFGDVGHGALLVVGAS